MFLLTAIYYRYLMISKKENINSFLDIYAPNWARCHICRFYNLAYGEFILLVLFYNEILFYIK